MKKRIESQELTALGITETGLWYVNNTDPLTIYETERGFEVESFNNCTFYKTFEELKNSFEYWGNFFQNLEEVEN